MPVEVIDTEKYDQAEERERLKKKTIEKEKNMETTHEAKKKRNEKIIHNPFIGAKKENEVKKQQDIAHLEKIYEELEAKKAKTEVAHIDAEVKKVVAEAKENEAFILIEQQLEDYSQTEIAQQTCDGINTMIAGGVYRDQIKKELLKRNLTNNLLIRRSNHRLSFNIINRMPLMVQYPLFVGMEILKTEDQYKNIVLSHQVQQQRKTQEQQKEEKKEEDERQE
jgi:hypothetical protein